MELDANLMSTLVLFFLAILAMKYMPRILAGVPFVPPSEVKGRMDAGEDVVIIDVRTNNEFAGGHAPGAVNLPLGELSIKLRQLGGDLDSFKTLPVYAMCRTDNRAANAARALKKAGFSDLKVVGGGMNAWKRAGFSVEK